jgi:hypothetical protein
MDRRRMSGVNLSVAKLHWKTITNVMDEVMKSKNFLVIREWHLHVLPTHEIFGLATTGLK